MLNIFEIISSFTTVGNAVYWNTFVASGTLNRWIKFYKHSDY